MIKIRRAEEKDSARVFEMLLSIAKLHHDGRPDLFKPASSKYTKQEFCEKLKNKNEHIFVAADENDEAVGYIFCIITESNGSAVLEDRKTLYIDDLCVDIKARNQHIATRLMDAAKQAAKDEGCYNMTLNVWACNEGAALFYKKYGMEPQSTHLETIL